MTQNARCPACRYDLTGLLEVCAEVTCPECGRRCSTADQPGSSPSTLTYILWIIAPAIAYGLFVAYASWVQSRDIALLGYPSNESEALDAPIMFGALWALVWLVGAAIVVGALAWSRPGRTRRRRATTAIILAPLAAIAAVLGPSLVLRLLGIG